MTDSAQPLSGRLVQIYQAHDEWEGTLILGYLRDNGIESTLQRPPSLPPFDGVEALSRSKRLFGIFVLENDATRAKPLVEEFISTVVDESVLAESAAEHLKLEKETIHRLRRELIEERKTFDALGWIGIIFFAAAALLWMIWPTVLKTALPYGLVQFLTLLLLILGALFAGSWAKRRMK